MTALLRCVHTLWVPLETESPPLQSERRTGAAKIITALTHSFPEMHSEAAARVRKNPRQMMGIIIDGGETRAIAFGEEWQHRYLQGGP